MAGLSPLTAVLSLEKEKNWAGPSGAAFPRGMNLFWGGVLIEDCPSPHIDVVKTAAVAIVANAIERNAVGFMVFISWYR